MGIIAPYYPNKTLRHNFNHETEQIANFLKRSVFAKARPERHVFALVSFAGQAAHDGERQLMAPRGTGHDVNGQAVVTLSADDGSASLLRSGLSRRSS